MNAKEKVSFSEVIKVARQIKTMTLRDLEKTTKISYSQLSKIERGDSIPSKENIEALASALELDKNYLLILAGFVPNEVTVGMAQLIYEMYSDEDDEPVIITPEDIILTRNKMYQSIEVKTHQHDLVTPGLDGEWARFINEMKKKNLTPSKLRDIVAFTNNVNKYIKNIEFLNE